MKKVFSLLMMAAAMTAMVACGEKDNDKDIPQSLAQTAWHCDEPDVTIWLTDGSHARFHQESLGEHFNWNGTYTYDSQNGSGTMTFDVAGASMSVTFTVKGDKMTVSQDGEQYVMDKIAYSDPGDNPGGGDEPGGGEEPGDDPMSLLGAWMQIVGNPDGDHTTYLLSFNSTAACYFSIAVRTSEDDETTNYFGTYTYANHSGSIDFMNESMTHQVGTATFTVNGNTITMDFLGQTYTLMKQ